MPPIEVVQRRYSPYSSGGLSFARNLEPMADGTMGGSILSPHKKAEQILARAVEILNKYSDVKREASQIKMEVAESSFPRYSRLLEKYGVGKKDRYEAVSTEYGRTEGGVILINYGKIKEDFPEDVAAQEACLVLTILHELEHNYWGFSNLPSLSKDGKEVELGVTALNEGYTELQARTVMEKDFPKEFGNNRSEMYEQYQRIARELLGVADVEVVQKAFYTGKTELIFNELFRFDQNLAFEFFEKVDSLSKVMESADKKEIGRRCDNIIEILKKLKGMRYESLDEVQVTLNAIWEALRRFYPDLVSKNATPPKVVAKGSVLDEESVNGLEMLTQRYHKSNRMAIAVGAGKQELDFELMNAAFYMYFGFDNKPVGENLAELITISIARYLSMEFFKSIYPGYSYEPIDRQYCEVGKKLASMVGRHGITAILLDRKNETICRLIEERYGADARKVLEKGPVYTDYPPTSIFLQLFAAEKIASMNGSGAFAKMQRWRGFEPIKFQQFKGEFEREPFKATFKLMSYAAPYLAPYYRTLSASSVLAYLNANDRITPEEVAAFALMLSTKEAGRDEINHVAYAAMFNVPSEMGWVVANHINMHVMENIAANGDNLMSLFAQIGSREELKILSDRVCDEFKGMNDDEMQKALEKNVYGILSRNIVKAGTGEGAKKMSFWLDKMETPDKRYVDGIAVGARGYYEAQSYADSGANAARIRSFADGANRILNEFALECSRRDVPLETFKERASGLEFANLPNGIQVPSIRELRIYGMDREQRIETAQAQFASAAQNAGLMANLMPDTVLFDSNAYDQDLATKMKSVFNGNPEAAMQFFSMSSGTGECVVGGYYFTTV